jgi:predicted  nucleic acid-binding Zn-ribbon protein
MRLKKEADVTDLTYHHVSNRDEVLPMSGSGNEDTTDKLQNRRVGEDSRAQILRMLDELGRELSGLRGEVSGLRGEFPVLRGELSDLRAEFIDFRDRVDSRLLKNTQPIGETLEAIRTSIQEVSADVADTKQTVGRIDRSISVLSRELLDVRTDIFTHEKRLTTLESRS